jgi:hypothetical protein
MSPNSARTERTPTSARSIRSRWNRWASPISTVTVGTPASVASRRSVPSGPSDEITTFVANDFATRATCLCSMSARTWIMFVRPRVEVWKSSP